MSSSGVVRVGVCGHDTEHLDGSRAEFVYQSGHLGEFTFKDLYGGTQPGDFRLSIVLVGKLSSPKLFTRSVWAPCASHLGGARLRLGHLPLRTGGALLVGSGR
ncbi:hypothetical protein RvY_02276 [Ramazzottius varieornatus]|uniref:Uncharacterized protein n=1 Tax=Ramazzottius varieornatus TaxID=947166 RepID=A0A1D1UMX7_RAMVA|nr:hypothetical protein RvY_02276 [Ramazzottius varieornatus]